MHKVLVHVATWILWEASNLHYGNGCQGTTIMRIEVVACKGLYKRPSSNVQYTTKDAKLLDRHITNEYHNPNSKARVQVRGLGTVSPDNRRRPDRYIVPQYSKLEMQLNPSQHIWGHIEAWRLVQLSCTNSIVLSWRAIFEIEQWNGPKRIQRWSLQATDWWHIRSDLLPGGALLAKSRNEIQTTAVTKTF